MHVCVTPDVARCFLTSRRMMPKDSSCCPVLNSFWVMPTSRRKKSVKAFPLLQRQTCRDSGREITDMLPRSR